MFHVKLCRLYDNVALFAFALRLRHKAGFADQIVHNLAFIRAHRLHWNSLAGVLYLGNKLGYDASQVVNAGLARAANVKN